ncbi:glycerophosphodiester phosphodiesterase family protein [Chloroflexus sp. Y-396-1]|uniref:glycerophosphodiester phosphodiesterase n=1 Tax=Chloroflexus sp. Y-396-1 TaxID=867845 RepID=UPI00048A4CE9|nr:glycerophosphodiester phosphodiesterase family protein [Chloroflexus sp. Y-396-1]
MTPLIIAHRGASADAPENTLAAFELARRQQADMIELDLQMTADGEIVVFHDDTTVRWNGQNEAVAHLTLAQLRRLNISGERVPTLAETLDWARHAAMPLNLELKRPGMAAHCIQLVREFRWADQVIISSFYEQALRELRVVDPTIRRGYLMGIRSYRPDIRLREFWPFLALRWIEATAWHPYHGLPGLNWVLPKVRQAGYQVNVWTVDDPVRLRELAVLGASGLITNTPAAARAALSLRISA